MAKRGFSGVLMRSYGARDHEATVLETEHLAPHFVRVRFHSPTLLDTVVVAPTAWVRFWFPDPEDPDVEHQRGYTLSEVDPDTGNFAVDMVLHQPAGPASAWAERVQPGTTVPVTTLGSSRFDVPEETPAGYLLIGDSASIPAINAILATVPAEVPLEVYLEQHHEDDLLIPLESHPRATIHWVPRAGEPSLAAAIEARDWSDWYAWAAPESGSLKHLRERLRDEFGFPKSEVHATAYWFYGREFGKKRPKDLPEEVVPSAGEPVADGGKVVDGGHVPDGETLPDGGALAGAATEADPAGSGAPDRSEDGAQPAARQGRWRAQAGGRLLAPLRRKLIVAGVAQGLVTLLQLAPFVLLVELARLLLAGAEAARLWTVGIWAAGLLVAGVLGSAALLAWLHRVDAHFSHGVRRDLLGKLARVPLGWFGRRGSGQVKQIVQDDTLALHYLVTHAVPDAVAAVVAPVAVLVYLFVVDWRIALVLFVPVLVYIVAFIIMMVQSGPKTPEAMRWAERMNDEAGAYLEGQPVVRVFGGAAASTFRSRLAEYVAFLDGWQRPLSGQKAFIDIVTRPTTFLLFICAHGTLLITGGSMRPVNLLPFLLLGTMFGARLLGIGYGLSGLRTGLLAARRIQVTLDETELTTPPSAPTPTPSAEFVGSARARMSAPTKSRETYELGGERSPGVGAADGGVAGTGVVELDRVGFEYRAGVPVLQDVSLRLEPGTVTALVGPSGSGKSTLAALLARFHDVTEGAIRIDGRDLRELTADELYARVGFVFQDARLVRGTVRENIALAVPDASLEQVIEVARAAQIHERIERLPQGYDTVLGPDAALSGGERQRLTIARALLADTPVLVLDEATAFADPESEYLVQQALDRLTAGRTVLVIAHRLHTVTGVDQIVVLEHGRIAETGTHEELLASNGRYRELWDARGASAHGNATQQPSTGQTAPGEPATDEDRTIAPTGAAR